MCFCMFWHFLAVFGRFWWVLVGFASFFPGGPGRFCNFCLVSVCFVGFSFFVLQIFRVSFTAMRQNNLFGGYLALGVAALFSMQAFVNMGVSSGLLPTKGLTLPFVSYGGSSLTVTCVLLALVFF